MKRTKILVLQLSVAVIFFAIWEFGTTVPLINGKAIFPPFFFSTPVDIFQRIGSDFASGKVWYHLWITLIETVLAFAVFSSVFGLHKKSFWLLFLTPILRQPTLCRVWYLRQYSRFGLALVSGPRWHLVLHWCSLLFSLTFIKVLEKLAQQY